MEVENISFVSTLRWNCINKECLICNNPIGHDCIKCENKLNPIDCMSIMNKNPDCKHSFHAHCLQQYHKSNNLKCPMCSYSWS
jgi:hypothetical protein